MARLLAPTLECAWRHGSSYARTGRRPFADGSAYTKLELTKTTTTTKGVVIANYRSNR